MMVMDANCYFGVDLREDEVALTAFRKSRLMLASNFLVGTLFSSSRFCFASNGELL